MVCGQRKNHEDAAADPLSQPIDRMNGVGPKRAEALGRLGIATMRDLLHHFPRTYEDRRRTDPIDSLEEGAFATIEAEVVNARAVRLRGRMSLAHVTLRDKTGEVAAVWFGQAYLARAFQPGSRGVFTGTVGKWKGLCLRNPEYEMLTGDDDDRLNAGRIVPIYRATDGISQRMLRRLIFDALELYGDADEDAIPEFLQSRHNWPAVPIAIRDVHYPADLDAARFARNRFAYEELLGIQINLARQRHMRQLAEGIQHVVNGERLGALKRALPFALTASQQRAMDEVLADMAAPHPMARLLQGDVGSGKTAVALHAIAAAADSGYQAALMAPTEILAEQHAATLRSRLAPLGIRVGLLTSSAKDAAEVRSRSQRGEIDAVVGTHALIQQTVNFHRLGLVVVDEQHRFGVLQRERLVAKGPAPDLLHITATPIPRTLAQTVYGSMDLSIIDELPPGRLPIKTQRVTPAKRQALFEHIREQSRQGGQSFIVCPLVDESEKRNLTPVIQHFEALRSGPLEGLRVGLLHGRMPWQEKDAAVRAFKNGEIEVLVSTTVIEVGVDCPNATTIVIEDAHQFGLAQLHQLRGRVGRGDRPSYCFLAGSPGTKEGRKRIEYLCTISNGFEIAEADLELRGPGELFGLRQAGETDLRIADLVRDARLIDQARRDAQELAENGLLDDTEFTAARFAAFSLPAAM